MKRLGIKGDKYRYTEIKVLLESIGGFNEYDIMCNNEESYYYINLFDEIDSEPLDGLLIDNTQIYTIDEFYQKFPYKLGDIVHDKTVDTNVEIIDMEWINNNVLYTCKVTDNHYYTEIAENLKPLTNNK